MGAYEGMNHHLEKSIVDYAIYFGYHESNIMILNGDLDGLKQNHNNIYKNLMTCDHHKDNRTPLQYGRDLVASWIFEDYIYEALKKAGICIERSGADLNRMILPNTKTSTESDFMITGPNGNQIKVELVNDYTGFWSRTGTLHLRDNKYAHLRESKSLLLAIVLTPDVQKFTIFDFRQDIPAKYISHHPAYGKPAYELTVSQDALYDFNIANIKHNLEEILEFL